MATGAEKAVLFQNHHQAEETCSDALNATRAIPGVSASRKVERMSALRVQSHREVLRSSCQLQKGLAPTFSWITRVYYAIKTSCSVSVSLLFKKQSIIRVTRSHHRAPAASYKEGSNHFRSILKKKKKVFIHLDPFECCKAT